jgi:hypothetical protein
VCGKRKRTFFRDVVPVAVVEGDLRFGRLAHELFHVVGAEGGVAAEKDVGDDTADAMYQSARAPGEREEARVPDCPEVHGLAVAFVIKHFWCYVAEAPSEGRELLFRGM